MAGDGGERTFAIPAARVRESVDKLLSRDVHPYFPPYLHLQQIAAETGSTTGLRPDWNRVHRELAVVGGPPQKPHLRPFWIGKRDNNQEWLGPNLSGSYSPSSVRRNVFYKVVETTADGSYNLRSGHAELAFDNLLDGERLPALAVAAFYLRDYGLISTNEPTPQELIEVFAVRYGYDPDGIDFQRLYDSSWTGKAGSWLGLLPEVGVDADG